MTLYDAIFTRRSVRSYRMEAIDENILKSIPEFLAEIKPLFPQIRTCVRILDRVTKKEKPGGLVNVTAPYYAVLYSEKKEKSDRNAGFLMQYLSLYLESKGIGSCFLGMASRKDPAEEAQGRSAVIVLAFGLPKNAKVRRDSEASRLSMDELCAWKEQPKTWVRQILEGARLAPSSMNSQPWRFVVYENRIHVFSRKSLEGRSRLQELNFGIMLANVMVTAEQIWVDLDIIRLENITHMSMPKNEYVLSILMKP
ncbi:MAG: nitroreductase family protein [Candidatus Limivivens sp.]|nr:nitroreductase family protein [Candidatus Limivivens sp.]